MPAIVTSCKLSVAEGARWEGKFGKRASDYLVGEVWLRRKTCRRRMRTGGRSTVKQQLSEE